MMVKFGKIEKSDLLIAGLASLLVLIIGFVGWWLIGPPIIVICVSIAVGLVLLGLVEIDRRLAQRCKQIEAMISLLAVVKPKLPLPQMGDWAICPDIACIIVREVLERKPRIILECGSGVSTLLMSYCLRELGEGHIWSLEHNPKYADIARKTVRAHGLQNFSTIIDAPLTELSLRGENWLWYDTGSLKDIGPVDILLVDGPPQGTQKMARYPALHVFSALLSDDALVIFDDASGRRGGPIARAWRKEFRQFKVERYHTEKGALILRKSHSSS
jgi:predicted O-methyltransferase YrrM